MNRHTNTWEKMPELRQKLIIKNFKAKVRARLQEIGRHVVFESTEALVDGVDEEQLTRLLEESLAETEGKIATKSSFGNYITQPFPVNLEQSTPLDADLME